jgi:nitrite reductase/ring-hydroxylating ferredoxin subunit
MIKEISKHDQNIVEVAKIDEIPAGKMKHIEIDGKELMIANINGKYFAVSDRCGHSNALLSMGILNGDIVTCPLHAAQFDVTAGKKVREPNLRVAVPEVDFPEGYQRNLKSVYEILSCIKTHDQEKYDIKIDGNKVKVILPAS